CSGGASHDSAEVEGFAIQLFELRDRTVSICVTLKIGDEFVGSMTSLNRRRPALKLFCYRSARLIVLRGMTRIVAVNASSHGDRSIPIRTGEIQPQTDFVDPRIESVFE